MFVKSILHCNIVLPCLVEEKKTFRGVEAIETVKAPTGDEPEKTCDVIFTIYDSDTFEGGNYNEECFEEHRGTVYILAFSVEDKTTLESVVSRWIPEVKEKAPKAALLIVGLKSDREKFEGLEEMISGIEVEGLDEPKYMECCALTGEDVQDVFNRAATLGKSLEVVYESKNVCCTIL